MARLAGISALIAVTLALPVAANAERLLLIDDKGGTEVRTTRLQPFDVYLVAERDSLPEISAVAYTLEVPAGILVVGEELLVDSLLGLGNSQAGMNLVFRCATGPRVRVLRFRCVTTRPMDAAALRLVPDRRTQFLGIVSCKDEDFAKFDAAPTQFTVHAR